MSEFKKKKVNKKTKLSKTSNKDNNIKMTPSKHRNNKAPQSIQKQFKMHLGKKKQIRLSFFLSVALIVLFVCLYLIILAFHPIGVGEYFSSIYRTIGNGKGYDIKLNGEEIIDTVKKNDYYYLLSASDLYCFNNNGKEISSIKHGFKNPILKTSETRSLIYGQGEEYLKIYNFDKEVFSTRFDNNVLSADICDNGIYAVSTFADGYDSVVKIFDKNHKSVYEWYSAEGIVGKTSFVKSGSALMIGTYTAKDGVINSKIKLLDFKSSKPVLEYSFDNDVIYEIYNLSKNKVCVLSEKTFRIIDLKEKTVTENKSDYSFKIANYNDRHLVLVNNLSANIDKNTVTVVDRKGSVKTTFTVDYPVSEIIYDNKCIYLLSESKIYVTDIEENKPTPMTSLSTQIF